ncbi:exodeoxyribonuclease VII large subunit [Chryseobacterium sp. CP-77]|uniref:exodeoxyribonuclease VII large subunit n=1 Tax=Chryseobacterium sp. CP-77 TaxID=3116594 RepID=UPI002ED0A771
MVRGGGDKQSMETFNDLQLSELFITIEAVTVTAIGHTVDETLLDKLADKRFHLPHDYGAGLHSIVEKLSHEKSNSRALLIDEVKKDVGKQFAEQVLTLEKQLKTKNDEFTEAQKNFKEQAENQIKIFTEQLKVRNEEVEKLKKDLTEKHGQQVKTLTDQLSKRNEEFQKFQESSAKQLQETQKSFSEQQKQRQQEMESYKKELNVLHEKNLQSVINEKTASLKAAVESLQQENVRLNTEVKNSKTDYLKIVIAAVIALVTGFLLAKLF